MFIFYLTTVQFGAWNLPSLRPCRHRIPGATRQEVPCTCHLTRQGIPPATCTTWPLPLISFQDKIRVIWRLKDSWTKICICRNMCFFCNFTLASHLQRHQLCGSGQWSVLRFVSIHVAEMECLHESSRRGEGRISLIAVFRLTMSWIPLDTHFCIYLNFWEFQKPHETVWDDLNWDFRRIPRQGDAWASTIRRQVTFWASAVSLWCWSPMQRRLLENMPLFVDLFGLCVLFFLCRYFFGL